MTDLTTLMGYHASGPAAECLFMLAMASLTSCDDNLMESSKGISISLLSIIKKTFTSSMRLLRLGLEKTFKYWCCSKLHISLGSLVNSSLPVSNGPIDLFALLCLSAYLKKYLEVL